jgi:hypothetical protein
MVRSRHYGSSVPIQATMATILLPPSPALNKPKKLWAVDEEQIHVCFDYSPAYRFLHSQASFLYIPASQSVAQYGAVSVVICSESIRNHGSV